MIDHSLQKLNLNGYHTIICKQIFTVFVFSKVSNWSKRDRLHTQYYDYFGKIRKNDNRFHNFSMKNGEILGRSPAYLSYYNNSLQPPISFIPPYLYIQYKKYLLSDALWSRRMTSFLKATWFVEGVMKSSAHHRWHIATAQSLQIHKRTLFNALFFIYFRFEKNVCW